MGEIKNKLKLSITERAERADNWVNAINGLGDASRDRTAASRFMGSQRRTDLRYFETLFAEDPVANRIACLPAKEMLRQGFRLDLGDGDGEQQAVIMADYDRLSASSHLIEALTFARALGGAAVFIGADDGRALDQPLDLTQIRTLDYLKVFTRQDLTPLAWYSNPMAESQRARSKFGETEIYQLSIPSQGGASGGQVPVHESRLLIFDGVTTTPQRRQMQQGWGESVYIQLEQSLSLFAQSVQGLSNALSDGDQAVFKLKGLLDILRSGPEGDEAIQRRLSLMARGRSVARAVALDSDSESFDYISRSYSGYDTGIYALMYNLSAGCGIPVTLLFGRSPAGLSATGESDIRFFYDMIKSEQELRLLPRLRYLLEIIMSARQGPLVGRVPKEWSITFKPLMQPTPLERADIRLKSAQADEIEINNNVIAASEARSSHYGGDEYDQDITLDASIDADDLALDDVSQGNDTGVL